MISLVKKHFFGFLVILMTSLTLLSCQKDLSGDLPIDLGPLPDLATKVASSVSGFVTDENNAAVVGASVSVGNLSTITDDYGYFAVSNAQVVKNAAVVTVVKSGYFNGIKTYIADQGKSAFFRIKLIPKTVAGTFSAASGGNVSLPNGLSISFPANAIVTASNNIAYTGTVNIAYSYINPQATDIMQIMPGDLRGIDEAGYLKLLTTYGMAAVEMSGSGGELLQIAAGSKANLTIPIPSAFISTAPASIPLWYFDEQIGLWKQQGSATKTGNAYVGEVSHFSFWNCDVPANYVRLTCTIVDTAGNPIPFAAVKLTVINNSANSRWGFTDATGYVGGLVPSNAQLLMEVYSDYNCGTVAFSQTINTSNTDITLGNIVINNTQYTAHITGTLTDCSSNPVTNGYIIMKVDQRYYRYAVNNTGAFDFNFVMCNNASSALFIGEDMTSGQQSSGLTSTITPGNNVIGNIQACGVSTSEFMNLVINGTSYAYTMPADTLYQNGQGNISNIIASSRNGSPSGGTTGSYSYMSFDNTAMAVGSVQNLSYFATSNIADSLYFTPPILVNITEYGAIGSGFISGNFNSTFLGAGTIPATYNIQCSFRVRRSF